MKSKGMTLIETLVGVSIGATAVAGTMSVWQDKTKKDVQESVANEIFLIASAVEKRILIDGYNIADWNKTTWNNSNEVVNDLLRKRLVAANSSCNGDWIPSLNSEEKAKLVPCELWTKIPYGLEAKAELTSDATGFIEDFNMVLSFDDDEKAISHLQDIKAIKNHSRKNTSTGEGVYSTTLINKNTNNSLSVTECIDAKSNCALLVNYNRAGSSEYIRADGSNAMIGEHFKFIESRGQAPLKCVRWKNTQSDGSGTWSMSNSSDLEECGIGIYKETGHPTSVDVVVNNGSFENVLLDKECNRYVEDINGQVVVDGKAPCGMLSQSEIYTVVDNIEATNLIGLNADFSVMDTGALYADTISAITIEASGTMKADMADIAGNIEIGGNAIITGNITANTITANEGHFTNYDLKFSEIDTRLDNIDSEIINVKNKDIVQDEDISDLFDAIKDLSSGSKNNSVVYDVLKEECNTKSKTYIGETREYCVDRGTQTYKNYILYSWNDNKQYCETTYSKEHVRGHCYRDHR